MTALRAADIARLTLLAAIWGASFIFTRALAPVLGAPLTASSRVLLAGIALIAYFRIIGFDAGLRRHWREFLVIGVLNSALPFLLFSFAALHLPASYSAILNATTPLFALLLSALWLGERLTAGRMYGLAAGVCGVALVTRAGPVEPDTMFAVAAGACLLAALSYAFAGMYIKRRATGITPMAIAGWAQFFAGVVLLPLIPVQVPVGPITPTVVAMTLVLALVCSGAAYLLYYRLMSDIGPTRTLSVTFLIPLFAMVWGALFLSETITPAMVAGCALIVGGTVLVNRPSRALAAARRATTGRT